MLEHRLNHVTKIKNARQDTRVKTILVNLCALRTPAVTETKNAICQFLYANRCVVKMTTVEAEKFAVDWCAMSAVEVTPTVHLIDLALIVNAEVRETKILHFIV